MTEEQIGNQFRVQESWARFPRGLHLSPTCVHLDQKHIDYNKDGTVIEQSQLKLHPQHYHWVQPQQEPESTLAFKAPGVCLRTLMDSLRRSLVLERYSETTLQVATQKSLSERKSEAQLLHDQSHKLKSPNIKSNFSNWRLIQKKKRKSCLKQLAEIQ